MNHGLLRAKSFDRDLDSSPGRLSPRFVNTASIACSGPVSWFTATQDTSHSTDAPRSTKAMT